MHNKTTNSSFRQSSCNRQGSSGLVRTAIGAICVSTILLCGCSASIKLDQAKPFDEAAAKLKQAFSQTRTPPNRLATTDRSARTVAEQGKTMQTVSPQTANLSPQHQTALVQPDSQSRGEVVRAAYQQTAAGQQLATPQTPSVEYVPNRPNAPMQSAVQMPAPAHDNFHQPALSGPGEDRTQFDSYSNSVQAPAISQPPGSSQSPGYKEAWVGEGQGQPLVEAGAPNATQISDPAHYAPMFPSTQTTGYPLTDYPAERPPAMGQPSGTGHLMDGMNLYGSELRQRTITGSEVAEQLRGENELLKREIQTLRGQLNQLSQHIKEQDRQLSQSRDELLRGQGVNAELRQSMARLKVKVQDVEREKIEIERNADKALREIETTLDNLLLDSVSKPTNPRNLNEIDNLKRTIRQ